MGQGRNLRLRGWPAILAIWLVVACGDGAGAGAGTGAGSGAADNPIVVENRQAGDSGWTLGQLVADDRAGQVKGYASRTSVGSNEAITFYVSVNRAQTYTIDIFRVGWYQGKGARMLLHVGPLDGQKQGTCRPEPRTGLIVCAWSPSYSLTVPPRWTSGIYLARLTNADGYRNYITFAVADTRPAALLYQQSVITYQAYNNYPNDGRTGKSLYEDNSFGANTVAGTSRAVKVSFDRPYAGDGAGDFLSWEVYFVRWAERSGYDVTYSTDIDTHAGGERLTSVRGFLSVGHDEYWSQAMYDSVQAARDAGVSLGFFGANAVYWQVRLEPSASGLPDRVVVCYKDAATDPVHGPTTTVHWRDPLLNRPEQALIGVQFTSWFKDLDPYPAYVAINSSSWVYNGTGVVDGTKVPRLVGYEADRYMSEFPGPSSTNRTLLSRSPFTDFSGRTDYANSSIYRAPSGAWVFAAGTIVWSWGLDNLGRRTQADARIQRTTANVLNAFVSGS
jgi:hypothetical protein